MVDRILATEIETRLADIHYPLSTSHFQLSNKSDATG
jgi:hypothetical protein